MPNHLGYVSSPNPPVSLHSDICKHGYLIRSLWSETSN